MIIFQSQTLSVTVVQLGGIGLVFESEPRVVAECCYFYGLYNNENTFLKDELHFVCKCEYK